jgi:hypothetical protein
MKHKLEFIILLTSYLFIQSCLSYTYPKGVKKANKIDFSYNGNPINFYYEKFPIIESNIDKSLRINSQPLRLIVCIHDSLNYETLSIGVKDTTVSLDKNNIIIPNDNNIGNIFNFSLEYSYHDTIFLKTNFDSIKIEMHPKYPLIQVNYFHGKWDIIYNIRPFIVF